MLSEKEKLEEELKLLKESYSLDVITTGEYEDAKQRAESKLKDLERKESSEPNAPESGEGKTEPVEQKEVEAEKTEEKSAEKKEGKHAWRKAQKAEIKEPQSISEEPMQEESAKSAEEIAQEEVAEAIKQSEQKKEKLAEVPEPEEDSPTEMYPAEGSKKMYAYAGIALVVAIGMYFFFFAENANSNLAGIDGNPGNNAGNAAFIACSSNDDCGKDGKAGICANRGKEDSECQYIDDPMVQLTILNSNSCFNCKTDRILSMLGGFFPNIEQKSIDIESEEGKQIAGEYKIYALPAYVFGSSITGTHNYEKLATAFSEAGGSYVMKSTVANSNYYIEREEIKGRLDLIVKPGQLASQEAEDNLKEFLEAFRGKVIFEKHSLDSKIAKELGINTFPAFLLNNKVKFNGVQSSEKIKENFCEMNNADECKIELAQSLV